LDFGNGRSERERSQAKLGEEGSEKEVLHLDGSLIC